MHRQRLVKQGSQFMPKVAKDKVIEALRFAASEIGVEQRHLDAIIQNLKPAIRLIPSSGGKPPVGGTRAGGFPDLPDAVTWPDTAGRERRAEPMPFVLQVNLDQVAALDVEHRLPSSGLLSFFFYTVDEDSGEEGRVLYIPGPLPALKQRRPPDGVSEEERYRSVPLEPRVEWTLPSPEALQMDDFEAWFELARHADAAQGLAAAVGDRFQLLGHPLFIQGGTLEEGQELLLQVSPDYSGEEAHTTGMAWGDGGNVYFLIRTKDLKARTFDRTDVLLDMC
jgi:uncharacterized protein YwqG